MAEEHVVTVAHEGEIAWVEINNPPVNATSLAVREGLTAAVEAVADARYAVLLCAGRTFIAGGDMSEFDGPAVPPHLPDVVRMIEDSAVPFLAVMHGTVLGGGFEIALGCAWRIAKRGTKFGLPEVNVGLIPGAGGTQRTPRLLGMNIAIDMAASGKMLTSDAMVAAGGIDAEFEGELKDVARAFLSNSPERPRKVRDRVAEPLSDEAMESRRARIANRAKGQKSPILNVDALGWSTLPFDEGQKRERALHLDLRQSTEARALRHAFFAERAVARSRVADGLKPGVLERIGVVGGGLMGAGIAMAALGSGYSVTLLEKDEAGTRAAKNRVHGLIDGALKRGRISEDAAGEQRSAFSVTHANAELADSDLVIEAVFEDIDVKHAVFEGLARVVRDDAILATNTSYIDPRDIFAGVANPGRCIGLHFFSPAHVMKLVEVVPLPATDPQVVATGFAFAKRLRKVPVCAGICDGFIGNRMLAEYRRVAEYLLADGALPRDVDAAVREIGFPMGPFELQDLTGLQIAWANRKRQAAERPAGQRYVTIADTLCEMERFGQRASGGWYDYHDGDRTPHPSPDVESVILDYSAQNGLSRRSFDRDTIKARILAVLSNEGARIVEEGIAETDAAVDMVQIHGYAFPRWLGGPMHQASETGWSKVGATMEMLAEESPGSWVLSDRVRDA